MEKKIILTKKIPLKCVEGASYERTIWWSDLLDMQGIKRTDGIYSFRWEKRQLPSSGFGFPDDDDSPKYVYDLIVTVIRKLEETDAEYYDRMREIAAKEKQDKEQRYLQYLKLKAEFENE
jgi:hypothetical protein